MKIFHHKGASAIINIVIALMYTAVTEINRSNVSDPPAIIASVLKDKLLAKSPLLSLSDLSDSKKSKALFYQKKLDSGNAIHSSADMHGIMRSLSPDGLKHIRANGAHWLTRQPNMVYAWLWELPGSMLHL